MYSSLQQESHALLYLSDSVKSKIQNCTISLQYTNQDSGFLIATGDSHASRFPFVVKPTKGKNELYVSQSKDTHMYKTGEVSQMIYVTETPDQHPMDGYSKNCCLDHPKVQLLTPEEHEMLKRVGKRVQQIERRLSAM